MPQFGKSALINKVLAENKNCTTIDILYNINKLHNALYDRSKGSYRVLNSALEYITSPCFYSDETYQKKIISRSVTEIPNNAKKIYFIKGMRFNRNEFKSLYPHLSITTLPENADCVVLPDNHHNVRNDHIFYSKRYNLYLSRDLHYLISRGFAGNWYNGDNINFEDPTLQNLITDIRNNKIDMKPSTIRVASEQDIIISNIVNCMDKPFILASQLFSSAKTEFREESITYEDLDSIYQQILSKDFDTAIAGVNVAASINPKKYGPFLYFLLQSVDLRMFRRSHKGQLLLLYCQREFLQNSKLKTFKYYETSNSDLYLKCSIRKIEDIMSAIKQNIFGKDVDMENIEKFFKLHLTQQLQNLSKYIKIRIEHIEL